MFDPTNTLKKLGATMLVAAAAAIAVPAAYAWDGPPDAIDRYNAPVSTWDGPPDAIDRYNAPAIVQDGSPDAIDRYRETQELVALDASRPAWDGPPDAIDRYRQTQELVALDMARGHWDGPPDAIDRYLGRTAAPATAVTVDTGFAWGEFGIGAGAMLGAVLLLVGISLGALAMRHRSGSLSTS